MTWLPNDLLDEVDDYRKQLKEEGVTCEYNGKRVLPCVHNVCPRCCLHCSMEEPRDILRELRERELRERKQVQ